MASADRVGSRASDVLRFERRHVHGCLSLALLVDPLFGSCCSAVSTHAVVIQLGADPRVLAASLPRLSLRWLPTWLPIDSLLLVSGCPREKRFLEENVEEEGSELELLRVSVTCLKYPI